jgi:hypothetical protein
MSLRGEGIEWVVYNADGITIMQVELLSVMLLCVLATLTPISLRICWQEPQPALCVLLDHMAPPAVCNSCAIPGMILLLP